ncbi:uncharacterized protein LOC126086768 [Elephas maximus indicus]|uniref:uncharacterized protein LOC126086768 n=1 Tax=Elephas maximus indicus TaxID=99487 RepID=UPI0021160ACA|nr:uncharacterized protein LOC126086768 [Elephas maximus indicus]
MVCFFMWFDIDCCLRAITGKLVFPENLLKRKMQSDPYQNCLWIITATLFPVRMKVRDLDHICLAVAGSVFLVQLGMDFWSLGFLWFLVSGRKNGLGKDQKKKKGGGEAKLPWIRSRSPSGSGNSNVNEATWEGWGRDKRDRRVAPRNIARVACLLGMTILSEIPEGHVAYVCWLCGDYPWGSGPLKPQSDPLLPVQSPASRFPCWDAALPAPKSVAASGDFLSRQPRRRAASADRQGPLPGLVQGSRAAPHACAVTAPGQKPGAKVPQLGRCTPGSKISRCLPGTPCPTSRVTVHPCGPAGPPPEVSSGE